MWDKQIVKESTQVIGTKNKIKTLHSPQTFGELWQVKVSQVVKV